MFSEEFECEMGEFFFECETTKETLETDNESVVMAKFHACQFPCEVFCNGDIIAEKYFEDDMVNDRVVLVEQIHDDAKEYVEL